MTIPSGNETSQANTLPKEDTERMDSLQELIRNCPHTEITFSDDPDNEEGACGFMIRVQGCELLEVCAPTLREVIDKSKDELKAVTSEREGGESK